MYIVRHPFLLTPVYTLKVLHLSDPRQGILLLVRQVKELGVQLNPNSN